MRETADRGSWRSYLEHTELDITIYWTAKWRCWAGGSVKGSEAQSRNYNFLSPQYTQREITRNVQRVEREEQTRKEPKDQQSRQKGTDCEKESKEVHTVLGGGERGQLGQGCVWVKCSEHWDQLARMTSSETWQFHRPGRSVQNWSAIGMG